MIRPIEAAGVVAAVAMLVYLSRPAAPAAANVVVIPPGEPLQTPQHVIRKRG